MQRVRDGLSRRVGVLLPGGERACCGVRDCVEGESEHEPRDDEREAAAERRGGVEDARGEQRGGEAGDERELGEPEQADSDHLAGEQVARPNGREDQLDDAVVLLLDDAGDHPLAVDGEGDEQEERAGIRDQGRGVGGLRLRRMERCRRQLRCRRQVVAERAHGRVRDRCCLRVDVRPEDEPVLREEQQRVDLLGFECPPSGCGRRDHAQRAPSRRRTALRRVERGGEAGGRRRRDGDAVRRLRFESICPERGRAADEREHDAASRRGRRCRAGARGSRAGRRA